MKPVITPLPLKGQRLLEAIVAILQRKKLNYTRPSTYPTYDALYHAVVPNAPARVLYVGHNLRKKGLDELNEWTMANPSLPKVTGLIVDAGKKRPGKGFFPSYKKTPVTDDAWWHEESRIAIAFDWSPYIGTQQATSPVFPADDLDADELAPRVQGKVSRIVRDTKIVREVKALHNHTCQLCKHQLELSPGVFYSEGHHLKPLGKPHNGPDKATNIVCVCPNCHVKLDYRRTKIHSGQLRVVSGHAVAQRFIDHHNKHCS